MQLVAGDATGVIHERVRLAVAADKGASGIREKIAAVLPELARKHSARAVGVGFGGPVDWRTGRICCSHQVEGWGQFELGRWLNEISGLPAVVDNDANVGSLGEACRGAGQGCNPSFYMTIGSGVGGGLVVDGRIYHGAQPGEAEIGHVRLDKQGRIVEQSCSGWAVDRKIRKLKEEGRRSVLCEWLGDVPGGEARLLARALEAGDAEAHRILEETADDLAFGLSHVTHLFHPEVIILGGGLSLMGEPWRAAVAAALPRYIMAAFQPGPQIRVAALGEDAIPTGALVLAGRLVGG